ncbi:hypothetical protein Pmani_000045 [Petrolisthes manimaculis]|uniref:Uncharacterized protein n=1 Tax=Petrolisthes manimaculis TaxID=1843537 RepID=A0AAE1ULP0_9EUCA|nr:hypothetical protein Pmani_000045 [Petrolisthes manimaculis]
MERLQEEECREEWKRVVERRLRSFDLGQMEGMEEVSRVFKEEMCGACGVRRRGREVKGTAWWTEEVKRAIEEKKKAYRDLLGGKGNGEVERLKRELYLEKKRVVKRVVSESKRRVDEEFGRNLSEKWRECKTVLERG